MGQPAKDEQEQEQELCELRNGRYVLIHSTFISIPPQPRQPKPPALAGLTRDPLSDDLL